MIDTEAKLLIVEDTENVEDGLRLTDLRQSIGLVDRPWTGAEMLQYVIEAEYCRQDLERHQNGIIRAELVPSPRGRGIG